MEPHSRAEKDQKTEEETRSNALASGDSSDQLAYKFADRYPEICVEAKQSDLGYFEWYRSMLDDTQPDGLPSICASSPETNPLAKGKLVVLGHSNTESIQLPPLPRTGY